jgi:hypothetical protein
MFSTPITFLKFSAAGPPGPDPATTAFLDATGITDPTISSAINTLVVSLKAANLWDKFYAIWPMVGGTATTCKYNLIDPRDLDAAYRMTWNGAWAFSAYGAGGNATDTYGNTHFVMGSDLDDVQNVSMGHYTLDNSAAVQAYVNSGISTRAGFTDSWAYYNDLGVNTNIGVFDPYKEDYRVGIFTAVNSQGLNWVDKESATSNKIYKNTTVSGSNTANTTSALIPTYPLFLGAVNEEEYRTYPYYSYPTGNTWAFGYIADSIGSANASTFYTIIEAFQTALDRSASQVDQDVLNYVNQVSRVGGTLTSTEVSAVNELTADLKAAGVWSKLDLFLPVLGTDPEAMVVNLVAPKNATWGWTYFGTPTLSASGILGNGTDAAVLSNWTLAENLVQSQLNDSHWSCYIKYNGAGTGNYLNGMLDTDGFGGYTKAGYGTFAGAAYGGLYGDQYAFGGGPGDADFNGFIYGENYATVPNPAGINELFINNFGYGIAGPYIRAFSANQKIAMLALGWTSQVNGMYQDFNTGEIRSWSMGARLNSTERTNYYNAVVAYQTALSRTA